jgi:hypothetical protein
MIPTTAYAILLTHPAGHLLVVAANICVPCREPSNVSKGQSFVMLDELDLPAVASCKINTKRNSIVNKLGTFDILGGNSCFDPVNHSPENVVLSVIRNAVLRSVSALPESPGTRSSAAMEHARNSEESRPFIHRFVASVTAQVLVKAIGVERGNLMVLLTMIHKQLPSSSLKISQIVRVSSNVAGI